MKDPPTNVLSCKIPTLNKITNLHQIGTKLGLGLDYVIERATYTSSNNRPASLYPICVRSEALGQAKQGSLAGQSNSAIHLYFSQNCSKF